MSNPHISLPRTLSEMLLDGIALGLLGFLCFTLASHWTDIPQTIPVHFDASGTPDSTGSRNILLFLPGIGLSFLIVLSVLRKVPYRLNYFLPMTEKNAERQYRNAIMMMGVLKVEVVGLFSFLGWKTVRIGLGLAEELDATFLPVFIAVILATVGFFVYNSFRLK